MKITITDKKRKDVFVSLFQVLKNCSSLINATFGLEELYIQGMDKSHICLFDIKINKKWFHSYDNNGVNQLCFDTNVFHSIISSKSENQDLIITYDDKNEDILQINFHSTESKKGDFKKAFKMPLVEYEYNELAIPIVDYDAEFSLASKQVTDIFSQLSNFGTDIMIKCCEQNIVLTTDGVNGEMNVDIEIDSLNSYSIVEGEEVALTYSLSYINKMCITNKLSNDVDFALSNECPMKISYHLEENSSVVFYIAPKMND